jgi:hypothetical protein
MKLKRLALNETSVVDLEPLRGMPLEELFLRNTKVVDLSPLRGMPLKNLNLRSGTTITDVSPLAECQSLRELILPPEAKDIGFLRALSGLELISYKGGLAGSAPQKSKGLLGRIRPHQKHRRAVGDLSPPPAGNRATWSRCERRLSARQPSQKHSPSPSGRGPG